MPDPITTAIATAAAGSAATALTAEAARILKDITARIRRKLSGNPDAPALPTDPHEADGSPEDAAALADALEQAFQAEPEFAEEIRALWENYRQEAAGTYTNNFNGNANKSVQVGEICGDTTFNL